MFDLLIDSVIFFFFMIRRPPRSTRTDTLFPYTTLFRSLRGGHPRWGLLPAALCLLHHSYPGRSEEHTSELQSLMRISYAVFCLQQKKKTCTNKATAWQRRNSRSRPVRRPCRSTTKMETSPIRPRSQQTRNRTRTPP